MSAAVAETREALLLERATRTAASYSEAARARLRTLVREGEDRALSAEWAADEDHARNALALYREAALLFMEARLVVERADASPGMSASEILARFRPLLLGAPAAPAAPLEAILEPAPAAALEAILAPPTTTPGEEELARVRATVRWLRALVEPRDVAELRFTRWVRVGLASLSLLALLFWSISGLIPDLIPGLLGANVALHKPVTASGLEPSAATTPDGLTDGVIVGVPFGIHTKVGDTPWVEVDLLGLYRIDKVKVYNRGDGWLAGGLPMTLQFSADHFTYVDVATRTTVFEQTTPWVARTGKRTARYVRVRGAHGAYLALSEIEVFGKKK